ALACEPVGLIPQVLGHSKRVMNDNDSRPRTQPFRGRKVDGELAPPRGDPRCRHPTASHLVARQEMCDIFRPKSNKTSDIRIPPGRPQLCSCSGDLSV